MDADLLDFGLGPVSNSNYQRGANRERQVAALLRQEGWVVTRSPKSGSPYDLHCSKADFPPRFVQVKGDKRSAFNSFPPQERWALSEIAEMGGGEAVLAYWPAHKPLQFIAEKDWP